MNEQLPGGLRIDVPFCSPSGDLADCTDAGPILVGIV
jgi:hypothetical protein